MTFAHALAASVPGAITVPAFVAALVILGMLALVGAAIAVRWIAGSERAHWGRVVALAVAVVLIIAGARLVIMTGKVSWIAYLDQWDGELLTVIQPFKQGAFTWAGLLASHNDHRILTTRLASLATFVVNGEWDNRVLVVTNYFLQGLSAAWLGILALRERTGSEVAAILALAVLPAALVNDWEDLVIGFQVVFQLLILFSLVAITLLPATRPGSAASWVGGAAAVLAAVTMSSGLLTCVVAAAGIALHAWVQGRIEVRAILAIAGCAALAAMMWVTRAHTAHAAFHAKGISQWLSAFWAYGAWPLPPSPLAFIILWTPWAWVTLRLFLRRQSTPFTFFIVCGGLWVVLQAAALAYGRATFLPLVGSRYTAILQWSAVLNVAALVVLWRGAAATDASPASRRPIAIVFAAAAVLLGFFAWRSEKTYREYLTSFRALTREHESRVATFMRHDDPQVFAEVPFPHKPYHLDERLVTMLRDPAMFATWPAPLRREKFRLTDAAALAQIEAGPLTIAARAAFRLGPAFIAIGLGIVAWLVWNARPRTIAPPPARPQAPRPVA